MTDKSAEIHFQNEILKHLVVNGWLRGKTENYNRELALYPEDLLGFVQESQDEQWQKFCALYPNNAEQKFLERVANQLNKTDPNAPAKDMRTFGTLGVLRHEIRDRGTRFFVVPVQTRTRFEPGYAGEFQKKSLPGSAGAGVFTLGN